MGSKKEEFLDQLKKQYDDLNYRWNIERNKLEAKAQHQSADAIQKFEEKREALRQLRSDMKTKIIELEVASENAVWEEVNQIRFRDQTTVEQVSSKTPSMTTIAQNGWRGEEKEKPLA